MTSKMHLCLLTCGLLATIGTTGCQSPAPTPARAFLPYQKIAIVTQDKTRELPPGRVAVIEDIVAGNLAKKGFDVVERSELKNLAEQHNKGLSELTEDDAPEIGKWVNADAVVFLRINLAESQQGFLNLLFGKIFDFPPSFNAKVELSGRLVDIEQGLVKWAGDARGTDTVFDNQDLGQAPRVAAGKFGGYVPYTDAAAIIGD